MDLQPGTTIVKNGHAVRLTHRSESGDGWIGTYISLTNGAMTGTDCLVEDESLPHYQPVPWEWTELEGSGLEHRYVWADGWRTLKHETRAAQV